MFDIKTPTHRNTPLTANHTFQGHVDDNGFRSSAGREEWESDDWRQTYQGAFFQDSLHSRGEYLWDHYNLRWNYEGHFYSDNKEGYGRVSYPEGGLFEGLFADNRRFGPGVFTQPDGRQDVGLWRGPRLVRLSAVVDGVPRLGTSLEAKVRLLRYRTLVLIKEDVQNVAREVLESLTDKETVLEGSGRLYSPLVRNERSLFFDKALHDSLYFGRDRGDEDITVELETQNEASETNVLSAEGENASGVTRPTKTVAATHLLSWNNGEQMKRLLRHVFRHRHFEVTLSYNMEWVVAGHRGKFSLPGDHEDACLNLLSCCLDGRIQTMAEVLNTADINLDVTDARGNSGLMYAASVDCHEAIDMLLDHGADVNLVNDEGFTPLSLCMMRILAVLKDVKDWGKAFLQRKDYKKAETGAEWRQRASYSQLNPNKSQNSAGCHIGISSTEEQTGSREVVAVPAVDQEYVLSLTPRPIPPPEKGRKGQKLQKGAKKSVKIVLSSHSEENSTLESRRAPNLDLIRETIAHLLRRGASPRVSEVVCPTLEMAIHARDVVLVELLLSHGADSNALNETGLTPLHVVGLITPSRELVEICELLLRYHADPNLGAQEEIERDSQVGILSERRPTDLVVGRKTPLHAICMRTDASLEGKEFLESMCRVLMEKGEADASITYLGHCPLSLALLRGHKDLARALLTSGRVDPNQALGRDLGVPLALLLSPHCAELHDSAALVEMCDILFEFGADPLKIFSARADEFRGNVLEWGYREMGALLREEKGKKGGQPKKKKGRDKTKQLMAVIDRLKDLGRSCLVRHIQGNLVQTLLTAIRQGSEKGTKEVKKWLTVSDAARCLQLLTEGDVTKVSRQEAHRVMTAVARGRGDQVQGHLYLLFGPEESEFDLLQGAEKDVSESSVESPKKERPLDRGFMQKKFDLQLSRSSTEIQQVKDSPFVVPPELDTNIEKFRVCFECLGRSEKVLLKCPKCKMIYFCSEECNLANDERSTKHGCQMLFYNEERDKYDEGDSDETWSTVDSDYDSDMVIEGDTDEDSNKEERKRKGKSKRIETDDEDSSKEDKKRRRRRGKKGETDDEDSEEKDKKKGRKKGKKGETDDEDLDKEDKKRRRKKGKIGETDNEDSDSKRVRRKGKKEERGDEDSDKEYKERGRRKGKKGETDDEDLEEEDKKKGRKKVKKSKKGETDDEDLDKEDKKRGRRKGKRGETDYEDSDKEDKKRGRRKDKKGETDDEDLDKRRRKKGKKGDTDDKDFDKEVKKRGRRKGKKGETDDEDSDKEDKKRGRRKGKKGETDDDSDKEDKKRGRRKGKKGETDDENSDKEDKKGGRRKGKKGETDDEDPDKKRGRKKGKKGDTDDEDSDKEDKKKRRKKGKKIETDDEDSENIMKSKRDKKKRDRTEEDKRRKGHKDDNEDDRKQAQKQKDSIGERRRKTKMRDESEDGSRKRKDESREKSKRDKRGESKGDRRRKPEKHEGDKKSKEKHRHKRDTKEKKYKDEDSESDHATTSDRRDKSKGRQKKDKTKSERSKKKDKEDGSKTERGRNRVKEKGEKSEGQKRGPIKKDGKIQKPGLEKKRPERDAGKSRERRPGEYKGAERKKGRSPSGTRKIEEGSDYGAAKPKDPKLGFPDKYEEFMLQVAGSSGWGHDLEGLILPYTVFRNGNFYYRLYGPTPKFVENYSLL